jgi:hypothetical protein
MGCINLWTTGAFGPHHSKNPLDNGLHKPLVNGAEGPHHSKNHWMLQIIIQKPNRKPFLSCSSKKTERKKNEPNKKKIGKCFG